MQIPNNNFFILKYNEIFPRIQTAEHQYTQTERKMDTSKSSRYSLNLKKILCNLMKDLETRFQDNSASHEEPMLYIITKEKID